MTHSLAWLFFTLLVVGAVAAAPHAGATMSDKEHERRNDDGTYDHNADFDHDAFLGRDEARRFEDMTPEESNEELRKIVKKIDVDGDGKVSRTELKDWITKVQKRYIATDTERQFQEYELPKGVTTITWRQYIKKTYGLDFGDASVTMGEAKDLYRKDGEFDYTDMIERDRKRWEAADVDGDKLLTKDEFQAFIHPEEFGHMHGTVVDETMHDIDKDNDGYISLEEYLGDMYDPSVGGEEPEWLQSERDSFAEHRDMDKDGRLDRVELKHWILPESFDHIESEVQHLMTEADGDTDSHLTEEEIMAHHDLFVGSQVTDFGEALTYHDDL